MIREKLSEYLLLSLQRDLGAMRLRNQNAIKKLSKPELLWGGEGGE